MCGTTIRPTMRASDLSAEGILGRIISICEKGGSVPRIYELAMELLRRQKAAGVGSEEDEE